MSEMKIYNAMVQCETGGDCLSFAIPDEVDEMCAALKRVLDRGDVHNIFIETEVIDSKDWDDPKRFGPGVSHFRITKRRTK